MSDLKTSIKIRLGSSYTISSVSTWTSIPMDLVVYDAQGEYSYADKGVKVKFSGTYLITGQVFWQTPASGNNMFQGAIYVNGTAVLSQSCLGLDTGTAYTSNMLASVFKLSDGDIVTLYGYSNASSRVVFASTSGTDASQTNLAVERLS